MFESRFERYVFSLFHLTSASPAQSIIHDIMAVPLSGLGLIFDCLGGTAADTRHTMRAAAVPRWFSSFQINIVQWASGCAFSTGNAAVRNGKPCVPHKKCVKQWIDRAALQPFSKGYRGFVKAFTRPDPLCKRGDGWLRMIRDRTAFRFLRRREQRQIIFRHDDRGQPAKPPVLFDT